MPPQKRTRWAENFDLTGIVIEFGSTLLRELDYEVEAYNARRLTRVLESVQGVRVPEVEYDLSSRGVLTLEFVPGVKSTNVDAITEAGLDPDALSSLVRLAMAEDLLGGVDITSAATIPGLRHILSSTRSRAPYSLSAPHCRMSCGRGCT